MMFQLVFSVVVYGDRRRRESDYAINPNERRLIERERGEHQQEIFADNYQ